MVNKPVIAILYRRDIPLDGEITKFTRLARHYLTDVQLVIADPSDFVEQEGRFFIEKGLELNSSGALNEATYNQRKPVHYLYKILKSFGTDLADPSLEARLPSVFARAKKEGPVSVGSLWKNVHRTASDLEIPVNISPGLQRTCVLKGRTEIAIQKYERTYGGPLQHIHHTFVDSSSTLLQVLEKNYNTGINTIVKPSSGSQSKGLRVIRSNRGITFNDRKKQDDISELCREIDRGFSYVTAPYLIDPLLVDNRKFDLRLYVIPHLNSSGSISVTYGGCVVRFASEPYDPKGIEDLRRSVSYVPQQGEIAEVKGKERVFEETTIFNENLLVTLLTSAQKVTTALFNHSRDKIPCAAIFGLDYLVDNSGRPYFLEANSTPGLLCWERPVQEYVGRHLHQSFYPKMIAEAMTYQQKVRQ